MLPVRPVQVVAVGCHPDDVELLVGGTLLSLKRQGIPFGIIDLTDGEPTPHGTPERRAAECAAATEVIGPAFRVNLGLPNRYLQDSIEARTQLASALRLARPRLLFSHHQLDAHPDHACAYHLTKAARFYTRLTKTQMPGEPVTIERIYHFASYHSLGQQAVSFIVPLEGEVFQDKVRAVSAYESQFSHKRQTRSVIEYLEHVNATLGFLGRAGFGEAFISEEPLVLDIALLLRP